MKRALIISGLEENPSAERGVKIAWHCGYSDITAVYPRKDYGNGLDPRSVQVPDFLEDAVRRLAGRCTASDDLFVYLTAHGTADMFKMDFFDSKGYKKDNGLHVSAVNFRKLIEMDYRTRVLVVSNCSGETFLDSIILKDRRTIGVASLGAQEARGKSQFNPKFFDGIMEGLTIRDAYRKARLHVVKNEHKGRSPYLYYPQSLPPDLRL